MSSSANQSNERISNPRRILVLTPSTQSRATIPPFLHALTGEAVQETRNTADNNNDIARTGFRSARGENSGAEAEADTQRGDDEDDNGVGEPSFAGYTTHSPLRLDTKYYTADVPIWVDEVPLSSAVDPSSSAEKQPTPTATLSSTPSPSTWTSEFLSPEAREVRDAIAAIVLCIRLPEPVGRAVPSDDAAALQGKKDVEAQVARLKEFVGSVAAVKEKMDEERGGMGDVSGILVLVRKHGGAGKAAHEERDDDGESGIVDSEEFGPTWWDEELSEMRIFDFEVVSWCPGTEQDEKRRNEFGELEGMPRVREILEANEWSSTDDAGDDEDLRQNLLGETHEEDGFDLEANELEKEMLGLRMAVENGGQNLDDDGGGGDDINDDQLETLMMRVQAIRDMGSDMPESERKKFAAKAIRDIMKDI